MSWYVRYKVLRVPINDCGLQYLADDDDPDDILQSKYPGAVSYKDAGKFTVTYTSDGSFLDYILEHEWDCDGEYCKVRELRDSEKELYRKVFQVICPDIDMDKVRLVDYCYYNSCEPDGYYDITTDPFYKELQFICSIEGLQ